jgi:hypothetical protein
MAPDKLFLPTPEDLFASLAPLVPPPRSAAAEPQR